MSNESFIDIDGFRITGTAKDIILAGFTIENAIDSLADKPGNSIWFPVTGNVVGDVKGIIQRVRLHSNSNVHMTVVQDSSFEDSTIFEDIKESFTQMNAKVHQRFSSKEPVEDTVE